MVEDIAELAAVTVLEVSGAVLEDKVVNKIPRKKFIIGLIIFLLIVGVIIVAYFVN